MLQRRAGALCDVVEYVVEEDASRDPGPGSQGVEQSSCRGAPCLYGIRRGSDRVDLPDPVCGHVEQRVLDPNPGWAQVPLNPLVERTQLVDLDSWGCRATARMRSTPTWMIASSDRSRLPGPSPARIAESPHSAAGAAKRTPAHARCSHVSSPVCVTNTPSWTRAHSRRRSSRWMSCGFSPLATAWRRLITPACRSSSSRISRFMPSDPRPRMTGPPPRGSSLWTSAAILCHQPHQDHGTTRSAYSSSVRGGLQTTVSAGVYVVWNFSVWWMSDSPCSRKVRVTSIWKPE
jgi:hypothetical protein